VEKFVVIYLAHYFVLFPIAKVLFVNIRYFFSDQASEERLVRKLVYWGNASDFTHIVIALIFLGFHTVPVRIESFCYIGWTFIVHWDFDTFIFLSFTTTIIAVLGHFSLFYLHRDAYYHKFFSLYFIFQLSLGLIVLSSSTNYMFMGWELLGLSSVLLIAFYEHRTNPLKNAMRVMFIYKVGDIFMFSLILLLLFLHVEDMAELISLQEHGYEWAMVLLIIACFIKSGVFPWIWLPRAMEGPTPSSAVFYGSLSTHVPIFVLLHVWPREWELFTYWPEVWTIWHPANAIVIAIAICMISAYVTTHMSRQLSDAKNTIAYATMTQLAIIYIEIFLGFHTLALIHVVSHGIYRTFEFLRTPSLLHHYHTMETRRPKMTNTGKHFNLILPENLRNWLYSLTINEFGFFSRTFDFIDQFLGLTFERYDKKVTIRFAVTVAIMWAAFSSIIFVFNGYHFNVKEELLTALAIGFTILSFLNMRKVVLFFLNLFCSVVLIYIMLVDKLKTDIDPMSVLSISDLIVIFAGIALYSILTSSQEKYPNYSAKLSRSSLSNLLLFALGLSIVDMPGLFNFVFWEYLVHNTATIAPYMVIKGFSVLSLNTLLVFLFYFSNFLGFPEHRVQMRHHYKHDTLHLRWVQKHTFVAPKNAEHRETRQVDDSRGVEKKA
jgi:NADH:ubiquinone oxidoreductase subunit 5 (subunit L)/multisubunit Na+/H+ antiporter MnhA subunit